MSTFDGVIKEYPLISIDCFLRKNNNFDSTSFFLSHCHEDHMHGLKSWQFYRHLESRKFSKIYLSDVSSHLLKNNYKYEHLSEYLEVLPMEEPTVIPLYDKDGKVDSRVVVTLLTAGHCLGSVMFFIEGNNGNVLYTGDFRLPIGSSARLTHLHDEKGCLKPLKSLYIDTTFCNTRCLYIPSREECLNAIISIAEPWLFEGPSHIVNISCPYEYGFEFVFVELFKRFGVKTHVKEEKRRMYVGIKEIEDAVTSCASEARIHACSLNYENLFKELVYHFKTPCGFVSPDENPIKIVEIKPSAMFFETYYFTEISWVDQDKSGKEFHRVCYSTHSSLSEIRDMVNYLKPEQVYPNVVVDQTEEQILLLLHSPTESESSSVSPLGKLKSLPVHDFSSYENDSLPFFDECYEISKEQKDKPNFSKKESHGDISVDTDFDNTEEQETMLKEEIYLQKEKAGKDSSQSPLKWHNPIISSDEEVFGNSSLEDSVKDKCDSDDAQGTSQESIVKSAEENKKISDFSTPKSSLSSIDLNSPSQSLISDHCSKYMSNNPKVLPEKKSQLEIKYLEKEERNNSKESCASKGCNEEKDMVKSSLNISPISTTAINGLIKYGNKENGFKNLNLLSHVSFPHHNKSLQNLSIEPNKSNTERKVSGKVEMPAHGVEERIHIQDYENIRENKPCVYIKTSPSDIAENKIHSLNADKASTSSKKRNSRSFRFIKKVDSSSDSEDEYSFKYVIKLPDKDKVNNFKDTNLPDMNTNRLNANNCRTDGEKCNPPDFTERPINLNVTINNDILNEEVEGENIDDKAKERMPEIRKERGFIDPTHNHFLMEGNEFKSETSEGKESIKENELKIHMHSQYAGSASSNASLKLDLSQPSHIQNITQEPVLENVKASSILPSSTISSAVSEMAQSEVLNEDQNDQEPVYERSKSLAYCETASQKTVSELTETKLIKDNNIAEIPAIKDTVTPISVKYENASKDPVLDRNFGKLLIAEPVQEPMNGIAYSSNSVPFLKDQNLTSVAQEQIREIHDDKPLYARIIQSSGFKEVDLSSDDEISIVGQMTNEKANQPLATKCEQYVTGISKQIVTHKDKILSRVLDLSSDGSDDEISIISEETTAKEKIPSTIIDLASDDSNDVFIINENFNTHCKVLSPEQNFYTRGASCLQNISHSKHSSKLNVASSNRENGFVKFKRNMSAREESYHLDNGNRCKMQRTCKYDESRNRVADGENRTDIKTSNLNKNSIRSADCAHSLSKTPFCSSINNTTTKFNSSCAKSIEKNANIAQEMKSLNQVSPTSCITIEDINSSSDLDDSPSLLAPRFAVMKETNSGNSTFVHSSSYPKKWETKYTNDFTLGKNNGCDKLNNKICDMYAKDSDSTPEDLI